MKFFASVILLFLFFTTSVYCQNDRFASSSKTPLSITVNGGMTLSKLSAKGFNIPGEPYGNMELSYLTDVQLEYQLSPELRIRSGVGFVRLGGKSDLQVTTDVTGRVLNDIRFVAKLSYIEIPLLLRYVVKRAGYHPYLASGVTVGFLRSTGLELDPALEAAFFVEDILVKPTRDEAIGFSLAVGVQIPIRGAFGIDIGGAYNLELTNQLNRSNDGLEQRARSWRFALGLFTAI
ncbi:MAG: outer membrane beta-barrel protein [Calditrichia bacterium]